MAYTPPRSISAPRMQTNAAWVSPSISFKAGSPLAPVEITGWTLSGVAVGAVGKRVPLTTANGKLVLDGTTAFRVSLGKADMSALGAGDVTIEIMRAAPDPIRPLIRLRGLNVHGVA